MLIMTCFDAVGFRAASNLASAVTWSEVARFTGPSGQTNNFTCSHPNWRIDWNYKPNSTYPEDAIFIIYLSQYQGGSVQTITKYGNATTSGIANVSDRQGQFNLQISAQYVENYTVVIEQDLDSVPEFSPLIFFSVLVVAVGVAAMVARKRNTSIVGH